MSLKLFNKPDDSNQFKPILAEIEEEPVSPLGQSVFWIVIATFSFFLGWAIWGEIDVVITARGKVVPEGNVKMLQPLTTGVIRQINVKEGDYVHKGDVLITVDPATTEPALASYQQNLRYLELEKARLNASSGTAGYSSPLSGTQHELYEASNQKIQQQIDSKGSALLKLSAKRQETQVEIAHLKADQAIQIEKKNRLEAVKDLIARADYDQVTDKILENESKLKQFEFELQQMTHDANQIQEEIGVIRSSYRADTLNDLSEREKRITEVKASVQQMSFQNAHQQIKAPVDGYVNELFVHTVGGVVTPAEKLMSIVPSNTPLKIEASVQNRDIGYVKQGLPVTIKVDTFDFQKYGTLKGKVTQIPKDSREIESSDRRQAAEAVYVVSILPLERMLMVDGKPEQLSTGLNVTSEIKVGKRRIIEFLLYPLFKHWNEGLSVR